MKIVAIIQARIGSTRLPGKVLKPILGKPMLWYIVQRLRSVSRIDEVVVATSEKEENNAIRVFCARNNILCFSGDETDVLDRFYKAAKKQNADVLLRITADCPLVDPTLVHQVLEEFFNGGYDYIGVATGAGAATEEFDGFRFPDGLDTEVFTFACLETAWKEAKNQPEREHVTVFIWKRPERFKLGSYKSSVDYSHMRWTVDTQEDFEFVQAIYTELYPTKPRFDMQDVLTFLKNHPSLLEKNKSFIGKEGYEQFWN